MSAALMPSISAISTPLDSSFTTTQRTKTWENVTIKEIGTEIAGRAGIALAWDVEGDPFTIKSVEQSEQTDCEFYMNLCNTYGLAMKVYAQKIVVYDREAYKKKGAAAVLSPSSMKSWSWQQDQAGTYTGGEFTYTSPATEKEIKVTVGKGSRILKQSGKADSKADAERKIKAAVAKAAEKPMAPPAPQVTEEDLDNVLPAAKAKRLRRRARNSCVAASVKVTARICPSVSPRSTTRRVTSVARVKVLPVPALASISCRPSRSISR